MGRRARTEAAGGPQKAVGLGVENQGIGGHMSEFSIAAPSVVTAASSHTHASGEPRPVPAAANDRTEGAVQRCSLDETVLRMNNLAAAFADLASTVVGSEASP